MRRSAWDGVIGNTFLGRKEFYPENIQSTGKKLSGNQHMWLKN
jgi:hypothetical protein